MINQLQGTWTLTCFIITKTWAKKILLEVDDLKVLRFPTTFLYVSKAICWKGFMSCVSADMYQLYMYMHCTCLPYNPQSHFPWTWSSLPWTLLLQGSFEGYHKSARPGPGDAQTLLKNDLADFLSSLWYFVFPFFSSQVSRCFQKSNWPHYRFLLLQ